VGRISDEDVARVRDATDIVALVSETVVLRKKGRLFWGNCPFHNEKTPSFKVDPATQLWHCFGCGIGGDVFGFVIRRDNVEFPDAVRLLAERARIELHETSGGLPTGRRERLIAACEAAADFFNMVLTTSKSADAAKARDYLQNRGFGLDVAKRFRLGFASGTGDGLTAHLRKQGFTADEIVGANLALERDGRLRDRFFARVMFPIADLSGRTIAFGGRVIGKGEPKYLNSAETPIFSKSSNLYAINMAKNEIVRRGSAIVVEGYTDVIALHEAGITNAVATLGTALTERHLKLLARFAERIVYLFDGDEAGLRAADRAAEFISWQATPESARSKLDLRVAVIPGGQDPADFVAAEGPEALGALVDAAGPLIRFVLDRRVDAHDVTTPEGRSAALASAATVLAGFKESVLAHDYASYLADRLSALAPRTQPLSTETVLRAVGNAKPASREAEEEQPAPACVELPSDPQWKAERELLRLLAIAPRLRERARELLQEDELADPQHAELFGLLVSAGSASGRELFDAVTAAEPTSVGILSEWLVDEGISEDAEHQMELLVARIKEFALRRRIAQLKTQMESLDPVKDRSTYDDIFETIVRLDRELHRLRQGR